MKVDSANIPKTKCPSVLDRLRPWLQPISAVAALVLVAGVLIGGAQPVAVGLFAAPWDKLAHTTVFGFLAVLLGVALRGVHLLHARAVLGVRNTLLLAALIAALIAGADEIHQIWLPGRTASLDDWFADVAGIVLALTGLRWVWRRSS